MIYEIVPLFIILLVAGILPTECYTNKGVITNPGNYGGLFYIEENNLLGESKQDLGQVI